MIRIREYFVGTWVLFGIALSSGAAWAGTQVAVIDTVQASAKLKQEVQQTVSNALYGQAVGVVPQESLTAEDVACTKTACFAALAKRVDATYVLLVQGSANPGGYRVALDLRDGATGRSLGTDGKDCELCAEEQFAPTVEERVNQLWTRVMQEQAVAAPVSTVAVPTTAERPGVDTTAVVPPWWKQRTPAVGLGFVGAGVLLAAAGIYYLAVDGNSVETNATTGRAIIVRDTAKWGWSLTGVGGASLAAGSAMIIWGRYDGSNVSVAVGPRSLGLQGRF
jgi:hypothetical protein